MGQCHEIFDLLFFCQWALEQWDKIFSRLVIISLRYLFLTLHGQEAIGIIILESSPENLIYRQESTGIGMLPGVLDTGELDLPVSTNK